jgi:flagellar hook-associated protein 1 FlgK
MLDLSIGLSALRAAQLGLNVTANNIANAGTPGYHRQRAEFVDRPPWEWNRHLLGTGVEVARIGRFYSRITESALTANRAAQADTSAQLETLRRIELLFTPGASGLLDKLGRFFNSLEELAARPDDLALRRIAVQNADALAREQNAMSAALADVKSQLDGEIQGLVDEINLLGAQIAGLNREIRVVEGRGLAANDLRDRRDQLINDLAERIDARLVESGQNQEVVLAGGDTLLIGDHFSPLELELDDAGVPFVTTDGLQIPLPLAGGRLAGLLSARREIVPRYEQQLDEFAAALIAAVDGVHAQGVGLDGPYSRLFGTRGVEDVSLPLAQAGGAFPVSAGELFVTVTSPSGDQTLHRIDIDPSSDSLQDVAAAISGIPNLQAVVDPQTGKLAILAASGYTFDFAGGLQTWPDTSGITGTSTPRIEGRYTGQANDTYTFEVIGSGTVGVTPGLLLQVRDSAGSLLTELAIGEGYTPGEALTVVNGVELRLSAGDLNNGDTFTVDVVADADTAGLLPALGINSFFQGDGAADIAVRRELLNDPSLLAAARSPEAGDSANLLRLLELRDGKLAGGLTFEQYLADAAAAVGDDVARAGDRQSELEVLGEQLEFERQSISGVDPNEEFAKLLEFQRSFEAAARYIAMINRTTDELLRII